MAGLWSQPQCRDESVDIGFAYQGDCIDYMYGRITVSDISRDISKEIFQPSPNSASSFVDTTEALKCSSPQICTNGTYTDLSIMSPIIGNGDGNAISIKPEFEESGYDDFARELIKDELIADIQKKLWTEYDNSSMQEQYMDESKMCSYDGSQHSEVNSIYTEDNVEDSLEADGMPDAEAMQFIAKMIKKSCKKKKGKSKGANSKSCSVSLHKIQFNDEGEWSEAQSDCVQCPEQQLQQLKGDGGPSDHCLRLLGHESCGCSACGGSSNNNPLERPFKCSVCGKAFWKKYGLKKHLIVHSDERPFKCDLCPKEFRRMDSLHLHRRTHTKERIACDTCGKVFSKSESLKKHRCSLNIKDKVVKKIKCTMCQSEFAQMTDLRKHMRAHTKDGSFVCSVCGKSYSRLYHLQQHEGRHTGVLPKCVICGKCFLKEDSLKQHVQLHSAVIEKKCEECGKDLHSLNSIRYHKIMHSGKKQYKCDVCGKEFYMLGHMRFHKKMHETDKKYTCAECGKHFFWLRSYQAHQLTHTNTALSCRTCMKSFNDEKVLQRHLIKKGH